MTDHSSEDLGDVNDHIVDTLAQILRIVDGKRTLGAVELAERLVENDVTFKRCDCGGELTECARCLIGTAQADCGCPKCIVDFNPVRGRMLQDIKDEIDELVRHPETTVYVASRLNRLRGEMIDLVFERNQTVLELSKEISDRVTEFDTLRHQHGLLMAAYELVQKHVYEQPLKNHVCCWSIQLGLDQHAHFRCCTCGMGPGEV